MKRYVMKEPDKQSEKRLQRRKNAVFPLALTEHRFTHRVFVATWHRDESFTRTTEESIPSLDFCIDS